MLNKLKRIIAVILVISVIFGMPINFAQPLDLDLDGDADGDGISNEEEFFNPDAAAAVDSGITGNGKYKKQLLFFTFPDTLIKRYSNGKHTATVSHGGVDYKLEFSDYTTQFKVWWHNNEHLRGVHVEDSLFSRAYKKAGNTSVQTYHSFYRIGTNYNVKVSAVKGGKPHPVQLVIFDSGSISNTQVSIVTAKDAPFKVFETFGNGGSIDGANTKRLVYSNTQNGTTAFITGNKNILYPGQRAVQGVIYNQPYTINFTGSSSPERLVHRYIRYAFAVLIPVDTDADGTPDYIDPDSDGDSIPDSIDKNRVVKDSTAPTAPTVETFKDGSAKITPKDVKTTGNNYLPSYKDNEADYDLRKLEIGYTDKEGASKTLTLLRTLTIKMSGGKPVVSKIWSTKASENLPSGINLNRQTGEVRIPAKYLKPESSVSAVSIDLSGNRSGATTTKIPKLLSPPKAEVKANQSGGVDITTKDGDGSTTAKVNKIIIKGTASTGVATNATITKTKSGWVSNNSHVVIKIDNGTNMPKITIPVNKIYPNSDLFVTQYGVNGTTGETTEYRVVDNTKPPKPSGSEQDNGSVRFDPPGDISDVRYIKVTYKAADGTDQTAYATKIVKREKNTDRIEWINGKTASNTPNDPSSATGKNSNIVVDPVTGRITIPADKIKEGTELIGAAVDNTFDETNNKSTEVKITKKDLTPPLPPKTKVDDSGNLVITPAAGSENGDKMVINYVDSSGSKQNVTATKSESGGNWALDPSNTSGISINSSTGAVTIAKNGTTPGSAVKVQASDSSENAAKPVTAYTKPPKPEVKAYGKTPSNESAPNGTVAGDVLITVPKNLAVGTIIEIKTTDKNGHKISAYAKVTANGLDLGSKNLTEITDNGTKYIRIPDSITHEGQNVDVTIIAPDGTKGETKTTKAQDITNPPAPSLVAHKDGSVTINPPADLSDVSSVEVKYGTSPNTTTITATYDKTDKTWSTTPSSLPSGVSIDAQTGVIKINSGTANQQKITATSKDAAENTTEASVTAQDPMADAPKAPTVSAHKTGGVTITPVTDDDKINEIVVKYKDKDGTNQSITATKADGTWSLSPVNSTGVEINGTTGEITIDKTAVEGGTDVEVTPKNTVAENEQAQTGATITVQANDVTAPSVPVLTANQDGSVVVALPTDAKTGDSVIIRGTGGISGQAVTAVIVKTAEGWKTSNNHIKIEDGAVTIPNKAVKSGTDLTAYSTDPAGNNSETATTTVTDKTPPEKAVVTAEDNGSITIKLPDASSDIAKVNITYTREGGEQNTVNIVVTKGDDGKYSGKPSPDGGVLPAGVQVNPVTGEIDIIEVEVKDGSKVSVTTEDDAGNKSAAVTEEAKDVTPPPAPAIIQSNDGTITIKPNSNEQGDKIVVKIGDENEVTINLNPQSSNLPNNWKIVDGNIIMPEQDKDTKIQISAQDSVSPTPNKTKPVTISAKGKLTPAAPVVKANDDGTVVITPGESNGVPLGSIEINYTDEGGQPEGVISAVQEGGAWKLQKKTVDSDGEETTEDFESKNIFVNENTGTVTLLPRGVKPDTEVVVNAVSKTGIVGDPVVVTAKDTDAPTAPKLDAKTNGDLSVTVPAGSTGTEMKIEYKDETGADSTLYLIKDGGKWTTKPGTNLPDGVELNASNGTVTIPEDRIYDGSVAKATISDGRKSASETSGEIQPKPEPAPTPPKPTPDPSPTPAPSPTPEPRAEYDNAPDYMQPASPAKPKDKDKKDKDKKDKDKDKKKDAKDLTPAEKAEIKTQRKKAYTRNSGAAEPVIPNDAGELETAYIKQMFVNQKSNMLEYVNIPFEEIPLAMVSFTRPYISGYPDGKFHGGEPLRRIELAVIFARILERTDAHKRPHNYNDIAADYWGAPYLQMIEGLGVFAGYPDGSFGPNNPVRRDELATVIAGFWKTRGFMPDTSPSPFTDIEDSWARDNINAMYNTGLISGRPDGGFHPAEALTRHEAVIIINKLINRPPRYDHDPNFPDVGEDNWNYGSVEAASQKQNRNIVNFEE